MYRKWDSMLGRCYRPSHPAWKWYGGRGITVCDRWRASYDAFHDDMGEAPPGYWLDRIDGTQPYGPGNCRWATPLESAQNRARTGPKPNPASLRQRALAAGLPYPIVYGRIHVLRWSAERALTTPVRKKRVWDE